MAVAGYKLWKYTVFCFGFFPGFIVGFTLGSVEFVDQNHTSVTLPVICGLVLGVVVGGIFLMCYFVVIFCTGCQCGISVTYVFWFVLLAAICNGTAIEVATCSTQSTNDYLIIVVVLALFVGVVGGVIAIKLNKLVIILATSCAFTNSCIQ